MAFIEGDGLRAPAPIMENLDPETVGECRRWAERRAQARNYAGRSDGWGRGFNPNAALVGDLGEVAVRQYVNRRLRREVIKLDRAVRNGGDRGIDFRCLGITFQVKTRQNGKDNLVRRVDDDGNLCPLVAQIFIFCRLETDPAADVQRVALLGWLPVDRLEEDGRREKSPRGDHHNLVVDDCLLDGMNRLADLLEGLME